MQLPSGGVLLRFVTYMAADISFDLCKPLCGQQGSPPLFHKGFEGFTQNHIAGERAGIEGQAWLSLAGALLQCHSEPLTLSTYTSAKPLMVI